MLPFDLRGPLPAHPSTTVLEASAGTGKTFALAALVTRYLAEGVATLDEMLLITFGRAASRELRERVRSQIRDAAAVFDDPGLIGDNELLEYLFDCDDEERAARRARLRDALANFDAATIATTHQFCQLVLKSLGVAGDTDAGVTLVESLDDLVVEIVDDLYLSRFGQRVEDPPFSRGEGLRLARDAVNNPGTQLRPSDPAPDTEAAARLGFANAVLAELERRKRRAGILGYDDLLSRLATALQAPDSPARARMRERWRIVMVDEFQDTDLTQWQVVERAFGGQCTVILIGDPKQAIYAFRGGDIVTYLQAARTAGERRTLGRELAHRQRARRAAADRAALRRARRSRDQGARRRGPLPRAPAGRGAPQRAVSAAGGEPGRLRRLRHQDDSDGSAACACGRRSGRRCAGAAGQWGHLRRACTRAHVMWR